jgi:hypothetical protein
MSLQEVYMRKLFLTAAAVATLLSAGILTTRSDAMTHGTPAGLRTAIGTTSTVEHVRLVRHHGWWSRHHRHHRHFWMHRHRHHHHHHFR